MFWSKTIKPWDTPQMQQFVSVIPAVRLVDDSNEAFLSLSLSSWFRGARFVFFLEDAMLSFFCHTGKNTSLIRKYSFLLSPLCKCDEVWQVVHCLCPCWHSNELKVVFWQSKLPLHFNGHERWGRSICGCSQLDAVAASSRGGIPTCLSLVLPRDPWDPFSSLFLLIWVNLCRISIFAALQGVNFRVSSTALLMKTKTVENRAN